MAKSKSTREFDYDGKKVMFNQAAFERAVNEKAAEINQENRAKRGGNAEVFRMIARLLFQIQSNKPDDFTSQVSTIKQWYYGNNGPSDVETIIKLAEIMECENRSAFLIEIKSKKEKDSMMERTTAEQLQVSINQNAIIEAMGKAREKEEAYRLYSAFAECMEQFLKADKDVWFEYEEGTPEWKAALAAFPKRLPLKSAIQKAKMFVSNETIIKAENLLDEMFGYQCYAFEEPSDINNNEILCFWTSEFFAKRLELYEEYRTEHGIKLEEGEPLRNYDWEEFALKLNNSWWGKLDEAFEEYIPERVYVFD